MIDRVMTQTYFFPRTLLMKNVDACMSLSLRAALITHNHWIFLQCSSNLSGKGCVSPATVIWGSAKLRHGDSRPSFGILSNISWNHSKCVANTYQSKSNYPIVKAFKAPITIHLMLRATFFPALKSLLILEICNFLFF